jgi:hypothetical protein
LWRAAVRRPPRICAPVCAGSGSNSGRASDRDSPTAPTAEASEPRSESTQTAPDSGPERLAASTRTVPVPAWDFRAASLVDLRSDRSSKSACPGPTGTSTSGGAPVANAAARDPLSSDRNSPEARPEAEPEARPEAEPEAKPEPDPEDPEPKDPDPEPGTPLGNSRSSPVRCPLIPATASKVEDRRSPPPAGVPLHVSYAPARPITFGDRQRFAHMSY